MIHQRKNRAFGIKGLTILVLPLLLLFLTAAIPKTRTINDTSKTTNPEFTNPKLLGEWIVVAMGEYQLPKHVRMKMTFDESGKVTMLSINDNIQTATFKLSADAKVIYVKSEDGDETWEIKTLTDTELLIYDQTSKEIISLVRASELIKWDSKITSINSEHKLEDAWNVVAIGTQPLPKNAKMVLTFTKNGKITMSSPEGKTQEATYQRDGSTIHVTSEDGDETWEIKTLTDSELIIHDPKSGEDISLKRATASNLPKENKAPNNPKKTEINSGIINSKLEGDWNIVAIGEQAMPEGAKMVLTFTKNGKITMLSPEGKTQEGTYQRKGNTIHVTSEDGDETWEIKTLTGSELIIHDQKSNEYITLRR